MRRSVALFRVNHMMQPASEPFVSYSPFHLENHDIYCRWRDNKLRHYPRKIDDLLVEINDPRKLTPSEFAAMLQRCRKTNMVVYASNTGTDPDPEIPLSLAGRFGVHDINKNWLADDNGMTSLKVNNTGDRQHYIPYTNRAINWHTDGYYNTASKQIQSLLLHVVQRAASGGENALMDHEVLYIMLREKNPDYIQALMNPQVLTIPARIKDGEVAREEEQGPVFSITDTGDLHMRFTIRESNVLWAKDPITQEALATINNIFVQPGDYIYRGLLEPGMGLVSNNVLHDRAAFTEDEVHQRHYYRARYYRRLAGTRIFD